METSSNHEKSNIISSVHPTWNWFVYDEIPVHFELPCWLAVSKLPVASRSCFSRSCFRTTFPQLTCDLLRSARHHGPHARQNMVSQGEKEMQDEKAGTKRKLKTLVISSRYWGPTRSWWNIWMWYNLVSCWTLVLLFVHSKGQDRRVSGLRLR